MSSSAIAGGILGEYVSIVNHTVLSPGSRIVYALSVACISIVFGLFLCFPFPKYYFSFPFDLCMGILLIVAASLLSAVSPLQVQTLLLCFPKGFRRSLTRRLQLTASAGCYSSWYATHWGWAWGGWWRRVPVGVATPAQVAGAGCRSWEAAIGFLFIAGFFWWGSCILVSIALASQESSFR